MRLGMTLLELIVVIAVIMILTAAGMVSFSLIDTRRLKSQADTLISDIWWARQVVSATNHDYNIFFDKPHNSYCLYDDSLYNFTSCTGVSHLDITRLDVQIQSAPANIVVYAPWGQLEANPVANTTIILSRGKKTKTLTISNATGYVTVN